MIDNYLCCLELVSVVSGVTNQERQNNVSSIYRLFIWAILALFIAGCVKDPGERKIDVSDRIVNVVTTTGMIADIAKNVGGQRVKVTALMGAGVDPHLYKASERDVSRLAGADVVFYNGLHLEGAMAEVLHQMRRYANTLAVSEHIPDSLLLSPAAFKDAHDPHIWFDVTLWMRAAEAVRDAFIEMDSAHTDTYRVNAADYLLRLSALHAYARERISTIPPGSRVLITAHDAFNYFGRAYGVEVRGLQGISTATEAGTADVKDLAQFIAERKIPAVFVESSVPQRNIEAVQAAVSSRGFEVLIGGELFSDALGSPGTPEGTYIGMVTHNVDAIVTALTGTNSADSAAGQ